jgi:hypothetical protein
MVTGRPATDGLALEDTAAVVFGRTFWLRDDEVDVE